MKLLFLIILKIFLILTIFIGCATTEDRLLSHGRFWLEKGQIDRSIVYFNKAIKKNPRYAEAYVDRGLAYFLKEQLDKACSDWKRACELGACKAYEGLMGRAFCK